jgi:hypothetical protein
MQTIQEPEAFDFCEDEIKNLAKELIANYHPTICNANIAYLWNTKEMKRKGRNVIATAEKCNKKVKAISGFDFIIVVSFPTWNTLTDKQKRAAIDHELTHCCLGDEEEEGKTIIIPHDIEEFLEIIERNNLYKDDLIALGRIIQKQINKNGKDDEKTLE